MIPSVEAAQKIGNRTRVEIIASILKIAANGALKTHIMYGANLSHGQLERYLAFLEERGMIARGRDEETGSPVYRVTETGLDFLKEYTRVSSYFTEKPG